MSKQGEKPLIEHNAKIYIDKKLFTAETKNKRK
jgi:hypothetical protein